MSLNIITVTLNMGEGSVGPPQWGAGHLGGPGPLSRPWGLPSGVRGAWVGQAPSEDTCSPLAPAERHHFLGISIVGQSNDRGDGGIYIGSIMKGGAVAADGRIEPGDMLLQVRGCGSCWGAERPAPPAHRAEPLPAPQVNDINFESMSNDDAVRVLREIVSQTG